MQQLHYSTGECLPLLGKWLIIKVATLRGIEPLLPP